MKPSNSRTVNAVRQAIDHAASAASSRTALGRRVAFQIIRGGPEPRRVFGNKPESRVAVVAEKRANAAALALVTDRATSPLGGLHVSIVRQTEAA